MLLVMMLADKEVPWQRTASGQFEEQCQPTPPLCFVQPLDNLVSTIESTTNCTASTGPGESPRSSRVQCTGLFLEEGQSAREEGGVGGSVWFNFPLISSRPGTTVQRMLRLYRNRLNLILVDLNSSCKYKFSFLALHHSLWFTGVVVLIFRDECLNLTK